jgi:hypothetical protein
MAAKNIKNRWPLTFLFLLLSAGQAFAGPYAPKAGDPGSTAVHMNDAAFEAWATGYVDYNAGSDVWVQWKTPDKALGKAVGDAFDVVSLGSGGSITLTFGIVIGNGSGDDFAIFENSFDDDFLELAYVEVSSDGVNFARFPCDSLTPGPVSAFGTVDPTDVDGLAGKYRQGYGTPFDLEDLTGEAEVQSALVNLSQISHVRIVDIVGNGGSLDSSGDKIYDPYPTFQSAGFDLDALGIINQGFLNSSPPEMPVLKTPANNEASVALPVLLETEAFSDPDLANGDSHSKTAWELSLLADFSDLITGVTSAQSLTNLKLFGSMLEGNTRYYWRARFFDSGGNASDWSDAFWFTTAASDDTDDNGIPEGQELPPGSAVDVNGDSTDDILQLDDTFKVLNTAVGGGQIGLKLTTGTAIDYITSMDPAEVEGAPSEVMALGLVTFKITVPVGGISKSTVYLSEAAPSGYSWLKYDPMNGWRVFSGAVFSADRRSVTLTLKDGGDGDFDGIANGVIIDPGGAGNLGSSGSNNGPGGGSGGSGGGSSSPGSNGAAGFGGGSGCFISTLR